MKKKIIYTIDTLSYGGAEKSTVEIVTKLSPDFEPVVVTFYRENELQPLLEEKGVRVININLKKKYDFIKGISSFKEICKREKPDLIVATLFRSEIISRIVSKQLGIKNIGTFVSDTYSPFALTQFSKAQLLKIKVLLLLNRFTAKFCTRFISNANSIKFSNAKILKVEHEIVDVIYRGRDVSQFDHNTDRNTDGYFRFVNVGRLRPAKGQGELIEAFAAFHKQYPYSKLDIAGEGPERGKLEKLIAELNLKGKVRLLGNVSNIPALLNDYHAFVFTSHYEGFSGALVEAMLAGIPVLASDIPMNTEAIEHLKTGYIFKVKNVASITQAMQYAANNYTHMSEMSATAKLLAQRLYDLDSIVRQHEMIYNNCIGSKAAVHSS
jgi:glycosyltransferase involved in cell wall biosynthesis